MLKTLPVARQTFATAVDSLKTTSISTRTPKPVKSHRDVTTASTSVAEKYEEAQPFSAIPQAFGLPYLGTLLKYKLNPKKVDGYKDDLLDYYKKYGKIFRETLAGEQAVYLYDPDYVHVIYQNDGKTPCIVPILDTIQTFRRLKDQSPGLGNTNGAEWYRLRSAVQKVMMNLNSVASFLPAINDVADDFVERLHRLRDPVTGIVPQLNNELAKWNFESSGMSCVEKRLGSMEAGPDSWQQQVLDANYLTFDLSTKLRFSIPWHKFFTTPTFKKLMDAEDLFTRTCTQLIVEACRKIVELQSSGQLKPGQYQFLIHLLSRNDVTQKDINILSQSMFSDGLTSVVPSLLGHMFLLAKNQEAQQNLYEEITRIVPDKTRPVTTEMLQEANYLKASIKETFRFYPVQAAVARVTQRNLVIGGYQIPAGTTVWMANNSLLREPQYFEDPDVFKPERWIRNASKSTVHPYLMLPFSFGPRACAGQRLAEQDMRLMMIKILQNFRLEWPQGEPDLGQKYNILMMLDRSAIPIKFIPRH